MSVVVAATFDAMSSGLMCKAIPPSCNDVPVTLRETRNRDDVGA